MFNFEIGRKFEIFDFGQPGFWDVVRFMSASLNIDGKVTQLSRKLVCQVWNEDKEIKCLPMISVLELGIGIDVAKHLRYDDLFDVDRKKMSNFNQIEHKLYFKQLIYIVFRWYIEKEYTHCKIQNGC